MILETIDNLCKRNGITITELERILEYGNGTIHKWEKAQPSIDKVTKVAAYFQISIDDLVMANHRRPSREAMGHAMDYDTLSSDQKNLVNCYVSIIKNGNQPQAICTTHSS